MKRKTDVQLLQTALRTWPDQRAGRNQLLEHFSKERKWDAAKVDRVLARAIEDADSCIAYRYKKYEFTGSESEKGALLYRQVATVLKNSWGPRHHMKDLRPFVTAHGGKHGAMDWMHPDVAILGTPKKKAHPNDTDKCHSFEVERLGGFKLDSIFQAYVQGKGSHFSWVVFHKRDVRTDAYKERVLWAANRVGVGLIAYEKPTAFSTWHTCLEAEPRKPTKAESLEFQEQAMGQLLHPW